MALNSGCAGGSWSLKIPDDVDNNNAGACVACARFHITTRGDSLSRSGTVRSTRMRGEEARAELSAHLMWEKCGKDV